MKKKKFIIYARSATQEQIGTRSPLDLQIRELERYAQKSDFEVVGVISEYRSGMNTKRAGLMILIQQIKAGQIDGVLCRDISRLSRNEVYLEKLMKLLDKKGIEVVTLANGRLQKQPELVNSIMLSIFKWKKEFMS